MTTKPLRKNIVRPSAMNMTKPIPGIGPSNIPGRGPKRESQFIPGRQGRSPFNPLVATKKTVLGDTIKATPFIDPRIATKKISSRTRESYPMSRLNEKPDLSTAELNARVKEANAKRGPRSAKALSDVAAEKQKAEALELRGMARTIKPGARNTQAKAVAAAMRKK